MAGLDPAKAGGWGAHAPLLHIKDATVLSTEGPMVGRRKRFAGFFRHGGGEARTYRMDDCERDMFEAAAQSFAYLTENGLARG